MKRICFFDTVKFWGGGEKFYLEYALAFKEKGYEVILVCDKESILSQRAKEHGLKQFHISIKMWSALNPLKVAKLARFYKKEQIDTVILSTSPDLKIGSLAAQIAGLPRIVFKRALAIPIKDRRINRYIFKNFITHIIANSEETKKTVLQNLSSVIDERKIQVIYDGIQVDKLENHEVKLLDAIVSKRKGIVLGNAGRLVSQKQQIHLLDVAVKLKKDNINFTLFIAGKGVLKEELELAIKERGLEEHVFMLGFIKDIMSFMNSIDIFLLSTYKEGFGYVLVEAMIAQKPAIVYDVTSTEIVVDEKTGFIVKYPDIEAFAEKTKLLINDENLRHKMGIAGSKRVKQKFVMSDKVKEIEDFLNAKPI